jgi:hypothetical protein
LQVPNAARENISSAAPEKFGKAILPVAVVPQFGARLKAFSGFNIP